MLLLFEDLHWIDPTSHGLLDRIIKDIEGRPVLLIATFRPEFQPPWMGELQVTVMALNRLDRNEIAALVGQLVGNKAPLPRDVIDEIIERTDGVPLFVEELTSLVKSFNTPWTSASLAPDAVVGNENLGLFVVTYVDFLADGDPGNCRDGAR